MKGVLTTRQAAEKLGVSLRTVQLWVESGILRAWKTAGGHRRIAEQSVQALLAEQQQALNPSPRGSAALRVLIVEDEPELLQLYRLTIESWQLDVQIDAASNGFEGLLRLGQCPPDILITDLVMPHMNGLEMLRILRNDSTYRNVLIMVVTTLTPDEIDTRGGLPADVTLLPKPVPFAIIESVLRKRIAAPPQGRTSFPGNSRHNELA